MERNASAAQIVVACDVDNPLTGSQGAGPQTSDDRPSVRQV